MNILGIGPLELIMIFIIILVVLGPKDMVKTGQNIGKFIRNVATSDFWKVMTQAKSELSTLPNKLAREAGLEEIDKEFKEIKKFTNVNNIGGSLESWTKLPVSKPTPEVDVETVKNPKEAPKENKNESGEK